MEKRVTFNETVWRVVRQPGVTTGARKPGGYDVQPESPGVWFYADDGTRRFTPVDVMNLPSQEEFDDTPLDTFLRWFSDSVEM